MLLKRNVHAQAAVYDVSRRINVNALRSSFHRVKGTHAVVWKHGLIEQSDLHYPVWALPTGSEQNAVHSAVKLMAELTHDIDLTELSAEPKTIIKAKHIPCEPYGESRVYGLLDDLESSTMVAIVCVSCDSLAGGVHNVVYANGEGIITQLRPGDMLVYKRTPGVVHTVSNVSNLTSEEGCMNMIVLGSTFV